MKGLITLLVLILINGLASATGGGGGAGGGDDPVVNDFQLQIGDFFGVCDYEKVEAYDIDETGQCISNFITPSIRFELLLTPFQELQDNLLNFQILESFNFIVNFLINAIRFILHFIFRFAVVYLLWVSLGFQVLINYIDRGKTLEHEEKVQYTFVLMAVGTLWAMVNGLGVIQWY